MNNEKELPTVVEMLQKTEGIKDAVKIEQIYEKTLQLAETSSDVNRYMELLGGSLVSNSGQLTLDTYKPMIIRLVKLNTLIKKQNPADLHWMLLGYNIFLHSLTDIIELEPKAIIEIIDLFGEHLKISSYSARKEHEVRRDSLLKMGKFDLAEKEYELAEDFDHSNYGPHKCSVCGEHLTAKYLLKTGNYSKGIPLGLKTIKNAQCDAPNKPLSAIILIPLLKENRLDEALNLFVNKSDQKSVRVIDFLTLTRNYTRAVKIIESNFKYYSTKMLIREKLSFYSSISLLIKQIKADGKLKLKINLPVDFPLKEKKNKYSLLELEKWFEKEIVGMLDKLNTRNSNSYYSQLYNEQMDLLKYAFEEQVDFS